jgi:hypothetical protein
VPLRECLAKTLRVYYSTAQGIKDFSKFLRVYNPKPSVNDFLGGSQQRKFRRTNGEEELMPGGFLVIIYPLQFYATPILFP